MLALSQVFEYAISDRLITMNPAKDRWLEVKARPPAKRPAIPEALYKQILKKIPALPKKADRLFMAIVAYTGMRRGEALALRWEDIDWQAGLIHITKAVALHGNKPVIGKPKSDSGFRVVPMLEGLRDILRRDAAVSGYIVCNNNGDLLTEHVVQRMSTRCRKALGMGDYTVHCFRHSVATAFIRIPGITHKTVTSILGHADISTTAKNVR